MSTSEAARALRINRTTLVRWIKKHGLQPADRTLGGHYRWDIEDLRRQLREAQKRQELESDQ
jgi:excisionase family DNA binding protein